MLNGRKNVVQRILSYGFACSVFLKLERGPHFSHPWCRQSGTPSTL